MIKIYTICVRHNRTTIVGPGTLLSELECVDCIDESSKPPVDQNDPEAVFISKITRHDGGNCCCGSCEPSFCYGCGHYTQFCTCWPGVTIYSPNYCNHRPEDQSYSCGNRFDGVKCQHAECRDDRVIPF